MKSVVPLLALSLLGCASQNATGPNVERTEAAIDLSGDWNDTDADQVASAMISDCLSAPWSDDWSAKKGKKPVLRLYPVRNKTDGYIDYRYFTKQIEAALVRSNRIDVVSAVDEAEDARNERSDQAEHASDETVKSQGNETGSDFILNGWIVTQDDHSGDKQLRAYLTSLEIIETETQKKAWVGQKRIKKLIKAP